MSRRAVDAAWACVVRAASSTAGTRGKTFFMARSTMWQIQGERGKPWIPEARYTVYGIPVTYDDRMPHLHITLETP